MSESTRPVSLWEGPRRVRESESVPSAHSSRITYAVQASVSGRPCSPWRLAIHNFISEDAVGWGS